MKDYVVYFASNKDFLENKEFEFEYSVEAKGEEQARQKAIEIFSTNNPDLKLENYTIGFSKN
tara:strand:- start:652 stop:837 length:186 start_codon:yes stop_codon:yes gene_type:complete